MSDTALVIMARYPEPGATKTRLARAIGKPDTVRLYHAFLSDLARRFTEQSYDLLWAYTPAEVDYTAFIATLVPDLTFCTRCFPQQGADLGARLLHAFRYGYNHQYRRTIVIGSDSPHIDLGVVADAQAALDEADVVLGPAEDGGYYLIAMRKPYDVFTAIPMSTSVVLEKTMDRAHQQGLKIRLLEPLFDVDELPDLLRLMSLLEADSSLAPVTAAHFAALRSQYEPNTGSHPAPFDLYRTNEPL